MSSTRTKTRDTHLDPTAGGECRGALQATSDPPQQLPVHRLATVGQSCFTVQLRQLPVGTSQLWAGVLDGRIAPLNALRFQGLSGSLVTLWSFLAQAKRHEHMTCARLTTQTGKCTSRVAVGCEPPAPPLGATQHKCGLITKLSRGYKVATHTADNLSHGL